MSTLWSKSPSNASPWIMPRRQGKSSPNAGVLELGGREEGTSTTLITEAAIRSMYRHWRGVMGL